MLARQATEVRKEWSAAIDEVIREKPMFIKRTRDTLILSDLKVLEAMLSAYQFSADRYTENDGSVTLALREIDLAANAACEEEVKKELAQSILEYAEDFYSNFSAWSSAPNRKAHIPYVFKALLIGNPDRLEVKVLCQGGEI